MHLLLSRLLEEEENQHLVKLRTRLWSYIFDSERPISCMLRHHDATLTV